MLSEFLSTGPEPTEETPLSQGHNAVQLDGGSVYSHFPGSRFRGVNHNSGFVKRDGVNGSHLLPTHPAPLHPQQQTALQLTLVTLEKQAVVITLTVLASFLEEKTAQNSEYF